MGTTSRFTCERHVEAEGGGFEPPWPLSKAFVLETRRLGPLCQPSVNRLWGRLSRRVRDSNPQSRFLGNVRFRNRCLTIQPTLRRSESSVELCDELRLISHLILSIVYCRPLYCSF